MKKKFLITIGGFVILTLSIGARFTWENYFSPQAKQNKIFEQNLQKYTSGMEAFEAAMRADTWGGKTPEETLAMFVDALKKGDIALASKYFMLDTNTQSPDYLTRNSIKKVLEEKESIGKIEELISLIESATSTSEKPLYEGDFGFVIKQNGEIISDVNMGLNKYSGVWKIESM